MSGEWGADLFAGGHIPDPHRPIESGAGQAGAVRAERPKDTVPVCPVSGVPICLPVATSQIRTVPSNPALARRVPSGLNAPKDTVPVCPVSGVPICLPVATSQIRTVPSNPALARRVPSGLNAPKDTVPVCPVSGMPICLPVATSQIRTVLSFLSFTSSGAPAVARWAPSGLNATVNIR
ncbi:hypothetical protein GCM10018952_70400 [Streptosporangium vulgare]